MNHTSNYAYINQSQHSTSLYQNVGKNQNIQNLMLTRDGPNVRL